jgi:TetR/AcrR family transcriptional regulator, regulator of cefoperazone and chloramphenicol sensitivity
MSLTLPADETRAKLLQASIAIFAEHGLEAASVRTICDAAGVKNIGAINYYFQTKDNLYTEAVNVALGKGELARAMQNLPQEMPVVQRLKHFITGMMHHHLGNANPAAIRLVMREFASPTAATVPAVETNIRPMRDMLQGIVAELAPNLTENEKLMTFCSIIGQCLYYVQNRPVSEILFTKAKWAELTPDLIAEHITQFSLAGLAKISTKKKAGAR